MLMLDKVRNGDSGRYGSRMGYTGSEDTRMGYGGSEGTYEAGKSTQAGYGETNMWPVENRIQTSMGGSERMNQIGFKIPPEMEKTYQMDASYQNRNEMEHSRSDMQMGRGESHSKLTKEMADQWMQGLQNEDGSQGPHWSLDQVKQVMAQKGVHADPFEFFAVLNSMYADYCKVFKKYGVGDKLDFYIDMAKAFIDDKDAGANKVVKYFENIVKQ